MRTDHVRPDLPELHRTDEETIARSVYTLSEMGISFGRHEKQVTDSKMGYIDGDLYE